MEAPVARWGVYDQDWGCCGDFSRLTAELMDEILTRLVKGGAFPLRLVCKSWYDALLLKTRLLRCRNKHHVDKDTWALCCNGEFHQVHHHTYYSLWNPTCESVKYLRGPPCNGTSSRCSEWGSTFTPVVSSCGLVCGFPQMNNDEKLGLQLMVWNPVTNASRKLPPANLPLEEDGRLYRGYRFCKFFVGMEANPTGNGYIVAVVFYLEDEKELSVLQYDSATGEWVKKQGLGEVERGGKKEEGEEGSIVGCINEMVVAYDPRRMALTSMISLKSHSNRSFLIYAGRFGDKYIKVDIKVRVYQWDSMTMTWEMLSSTNLPTGRYVLYATVVKDRLQICTGDERYYDRKIMVFNFVTSEWSTCSADEGGCHFVRCCAFTFAPNLIAQAP